MNRLLKRVKSVAKDYYRKTGRPLGVTGEVAEFEACRILGLCPAPVRQAGYDAERRIGKRIYRIQIKGRMLAEGAKVSQRTGSIRLNHEWDSTILVILNHHMDAVIMFEADRDAIAKALRKPGSRARNERGQLAVSQFKAIGREIWRCD